MKFDIDDRVFISGRGAPYDGNYGTIDGISANHIGNFYIVRLDEPLSVEGFKKPFHRVTALGKDLRKTKSKKPPSETGITPVQKNGSCLLLTLHVEDLEGPFHLSKEMWETFGRMAGWLAVPPLRKSFRTFEEFCDLIELLCQQGLCSYDTFADYRELEKTWGFKHWATFAGLEKLCQEAWENPFLTLTSHPSSVVILVRWVSQGEVMRFRDLGAWNSPLEAYEAALLEALERKINNGTR